ncbi:MAG: sigma-70 family RNA polymerase sigma factor [Pirellulales bacterium]|nr:sigma-70 family RNA polymerase sigma factor [Pirellulales bacterium]
MALSEIDRSLLERCLARKPRSWEDFVDRFLGLVIHTINHSARARSVRISKEDREDLAAQVFLEIIKGDFQVLRAFRQQSSLATYLTVIARRVVVRELVNRKSPTRLRDVAPVGREPEPPQRISDQDEVERLMDELGGVEADIVRMYHMEGRSYREISEQTGMAENSIGPLLSKARGKMRRTAKESAV